ncbi:hypothetical protein [Roseobacter sp.]|uniref:hypothetical protein n=1 Tax=Roseobacter sp. TaxID=1907202 RepID=UPI0025D01BD8|nr:hypothetical protein [Roseobacter sp.]
MDLVINPDHDNPDTFSTCQVGGRLITGTDQRLDSFENFDEALTSFKVRTPVFASQVSPARCRRAPPSSGGLFDDRFAETTANGLTF